MKGKKGVYTIGFKGLTPEQFVQRLVQNKIELLLDVRFRAKSRKTGFSKTKLVALLNQNGIEYQHEHHLGTPPEILREVWRRGGYYEPGFSDYRPRLEKSLAAQATLRRIAKLAQTKRVCLMSYETDPARCHRTVLAEKLSGHSGEDICHL